MVHALSSWMSDPSKPDPQSAPRNANVAAHDGAIGGSGGKGGGVSGLTADGNERPRPIKK
jgi:hypothetical protein